MESTEKALFAEGAAEPVQNSQRVYQTTPRSRLLLAGTLLFCLLLADAVLWAKSLGMGVTAVVFAWYTLLPAAVGQDVLFRRWESRVLLGANLALASTFALTSNPMFRCWNFLALLALLPLHACSLSGAALLPWWQPAMLWERTVLLCRGLFCHLGAAPAALSSGKGRRDSGRSLSIVLGLCASLALVSILLPVLSSADALFAAAARGAADFIRTHFAETLWKLAISLVMTPFLFGLLYFLRHALPGKAAAHSGFRADGLLFAIILGALDGLYLLFLAIQSAGLFGGPEYLAQKGLSYAEWARSGFFQMVGVTVVNLIAAMAAVSLSRQQEDSWPAVRLLATALAGESLILLASAAWRMTLYVSAYGLSFKRFMTYWGMGMMALFLLAALEKVWKPRSSFCRRALPLALAGWLVINCVPVDYLVARDQVNRRLSGESAAIDAEYLLYGLSYDTLSQLQRLDGNLICRGGGGYRTLSLLLEQRREDARRTCGDWRSWNLSACLAAGGGTP